MTDTPEATSAEAKPAEAKPETPPVPSSRLGRFIVKYPTFLSSLVVGIAGLIATSIWQCRQSANQKAQAEAAQKVAETQAANSWKIERADILAKNLATLASSGSASADQRFGVLLSLTRAEILDPELAVSYALELGKDNAEYMQSVLANVQNMDYGRLVRAYTLPCEERYGVSPAIDACNDKLAARSAAIAQLVADETEAALAGDQAGPLVLLKDERRVQLDVQQLTGLFETAVTSMYERRQWDELTKLEATSQGAHLVAALILSAARTGEFVTDEEARTLAQFHAEQTRWLADYISNTGCDAECKGRTLEVMVSHYDESQGDFDTAVRHMLESSRQQSGIALARLHSRMLWCQIDNSDLVPLRDRVLVPAAADIVKAARSDPAVRDGLVSLLALAPESTDAAWTALLADPAVGKQVRERRAVAQRQRQTPPTQLKRYDFCLASTASPVTNDPGTSPPAP
jgi:hypothetical protein